MYSDLYWFNKGEYFTEFSSSIVYPYFSSLKSVPSFLFVYYLFILSIYLPTYLSIIVIISSLLFTIIFTFSKNGI